MLERSKREKRKIKVYKRREKEKLKRRGERQEGNMCVTETRERDLTDI